MTIRGDMRVIYLSTDLPIYLPIYLFTHLPIHQSTHLSVYLSTYLSFRKAHGLLPLPHPLLEVPPPLLPAHGNLRHSGWCTEGEVWVGGIEVRVVLKEWY